MNARVDPVNESEAQFCPPPDLVARLKKDYVLSVMRLAIGRADDPLSILLEMDDLLRLPSEERSKRFATILAGLESRVSPAVANEVVESVYL